MDSSREEERRSPASVLARSAVAAKKDADELEEALESVGRTQLRRRAEMRNALEAARSREQEALSALGQFRS
jgi:hypothetical protein